MDDKPPTSMAQRLEFEFPELWIVLKVCKEEGANPKLIDLTMDGIAVRRDGVSV